MVTVSVPTVPEEPEPSAYWISQVAPDNSFQVVLLVGSKTLWFFCEAAGRLVEKTQLQIRELLFRISISCSNLQIGTSSVEVEVQGLSANVNLTDVLDIIGVWLGWYGAILALYEVTEKNVEDVVWLGGSQAVLGVCLEQGKRAIAVVVAVVDGRDAEGVGGARLNGGGSGNTSSRGDEQSKLAGGDHFGGGLT